MLLAVDPSLHSVGLALFKDGQLTGTTRIQPEFEEVPPIGFRCFIVANLIRQHYSVIWGGTPMGCKLIFEWPQIYRTVKSKGDPNDLIPLAGVGMALAGLLGVVPQTPTPAEWAGQLPKTTKGDVSSSPRARRIRSRLSSAELEHWRDQHDLIDAIGLGLNALGRLQAKRVFPGAT